MEKGKTCYLTTFDNPFDKFEDYDSWLNFDTTEMGYYSDAYLDRIARITRSMSDAEIENEYERAIDEIIKYDFRNIYTKKYVDLPQAENEDDESETLDEILSKYVWGGIR